MGKSSARLPEKQYLRYIILILCLVTLMIYGNVPVDADFSGLVIIPTADVIGDGQFSVGPIITGPDPGTRTNVYTLSSLFGIGDNLEAGVDIGLNRITDSRAILAIKYLVPTITRGNRAFAIGSFDLNQNLIKTPYMVLTQNFGLMRGHLGALHFEGENNWFVGLDSGATLGNFTLMADYTSGSENFSSVGVYYQFNESLGLQLGNQFPNAGGDSVFNIQISFSGYYK